MQIPINERVLIASLILMSRALTLLAKAKNDFAEARQTSISALTPSGTEDVISNASRKCEWRQFLALDSFPSIDSAMLQETKSDSV
jgi:hypothetical protein